MRQPVYLDYNATTPLAPSVIETMTSAMTEAWGNPSSGHAYGRAAREVVERARTHVAMLLGAQPEEILLTGGGSESDNTAIVGAAHALASRGRHVVTTMVEHPAVEEPCRWLERLGWRVSRVGVDGDGRVSAESIGRSLRDDTVLVSVIHAQNETGVLQPIAEIAALTRPRGVLLHADAAQSVGKIGVDVDELGVDLLTVAGHKFYGPKGVGALYVRRGTPLEPLIHGAAHEAGRRAGTENVVGAAGLGEACRLALEERAGRARHSRSLRDRLESGLRARLPDLVVHGASVERLPGTLSCAIPGLDANELLGRVEHVACSAGAACHADSPTPSATLSAMGVPRELALATVRLSVGRPTTEEDVDRAVGMIADAAAGLR